MKSLPTELPYVPSAVVLIHHHLRMIYFAGREREAGGRPQEQKDPGSDVCRSLALVNWIVRN